MAFLVMVWTIPPSHVRHPPVLGSSLSLAEEEKMVDHGEDGTLEDVRQAATHSHQQSFSFKHC